MKKIALFIALIVFSIGLFSEIIEYNISCSDPDIDLKNNYSVIQFENTVQSGETGKPSLPYFGVQLLLPQGHKAASIEVMGNDLIQIEGEHVLYPVQTQSPFSTDFKIQFIEAVDPVYGVSEAFPENAFNDFRTDYYSGYSILSVAVSPVQYIPAAETVNYYRNLTISVTTEQINDAYRLERFINDKENVVSNLYKIVNNPEMINTYNTRNLREDTIDYLVIAEESTFDLWQQLTQIHNSFGRTTDIISIDYILNNYEGSDDPEKLRNFLIEQYEEYAIQYVLLAGDTDLIPHKGLYGIVNAGSQNPTTDLDIPADMYYSCLDRGDDPGLGPDWNNDNDNLWGEQDEADLIPEFAIGRFPYNNEQEIVDFINKVDYYMNSPVEDQLTTALFVGEDLGWTSWGGEYMDEMIGGSDNYAYSTVGVPTDWNIATLYDMNAYWSQNDLYNEMNQGPNLLSHLGHSSTQYTMKLYNNNVNTSNITNNGIENNFTIVFTQGCYGGAFDNRSSNGSYVGDCITEKFLSIPTGVVSMISHSRFGWGSSYDTNGASQHYNREYNDAIFGEGIFELGNSLSDAKIDVIPHMSNVMFWVAYETNLIGDPGLIVWTGTPEEMVVTHPDDLIIGSQQLELNCNISDAKVAVMLDGQLIGTAVTGGTGSATVEFDSALENLGELNLKISKHNYISYESVINIIPANGPYVICSNVEYLESGDYVDGVIQSLDIVDLNITVNNIGLESADETVDIYLTTTSDQVTLLNDHCNLTGIGALEESIIENAFQIELNSGIPNAEIIEFTVEISSGSDNWQSSLFLTVFAPVLSFGSYSIIPTSGDDLSLDPGETADLYVTFVNEGGGYSYQLNTSIYSYDPFVSVTGFSTDAEIAPNDELTISQPFIVSVLESCPMDYFAELEILAYDIVASGLFTTFSIPVGLTGYNFEDATEWEHESLSAGFSDEWHLETYRNHTDNGTFSMKCGGNGSAEYSASLHAALTSPTIPLSGSTIIKFWHWMNAEIQNAATAWDGGLIEASFNGGEFSPIQPVGGYPYTIVDNQDSPFDPGMPVFSGNHDWEQVELDFTGYTGNVQLRFVFGADGYVGGEGWYIDDVTIENTVASDNDIVVPVATELKQNYPNPFNPTTNIVFSVAQSDVITKISIYNVRGQKVITLVNDVLQAGEHTVVWTGKDLAGNNVTSGVYFAKLKSGKFTSLKKMILIK
jgi:peptidase C25-like protein/type IX secretion system substrate protein